MADSIDTEEQRRYTLATGDAAARRLELIQRAWGPGSKAMAVRAGLRPGMRVADFGCGVGTVTRMFAEMVGPGGGVTGIDQSAEQLEQARARNADAPHVRFIQADVTATGLPEASFDFAYCRLLLMHLPKPLAGLAEMRRVLRPGGRLLVEDPDLATGYSVPPSAMERFNDLYMKLGAARGLDFRLGKRLHQVVMEAGFEGLEVGLNQPAFMLGPERQLFRLSLAESGPALHEAGVCTPEELARIVEQMKAAEADPTLLAVLPAMVQVAAVKPD